MTAARVCLGLFLHSHQPVGNYDHVFADHWERSYRPMLEALTAHPGVRATLHYSGPLIDWLSAKRPDFEPMLGRLVQRGQVEVAGGGYYEPILAMLPEIDRHGQLGLMAAEVERRWGSRPLGAWLTERVWEPHLAASLARAGVRYTLVDDTHFASAGLAESDLDSHYLTEDDGQPLAIFAGLRSLRQRIPWRPVEEVLDWLRERATSGPARLFCLGDDGEKFGGWPQTFEYCWGKDGGWVERFFAALEQNSAWLETVRLGDWLEREPPKGPVYLPTASYQEMEEWTLPLDTAEVRKRHIVELQQSGIETLPLRPGYWRTFLVKYPEVRAMHERILRTRALLDGLDPASAAEAERELWTGECNCAFWHGIFGGVYLRRIRMANLRHLARSERLARAASVPAAALVRSDLDLDGREEFLFATPSQQVLLDPAEGGSILEWDLHGFDWPLLSVMARRPEAYHRGIAVGEASAISPGVRGHSDLGEVSLTYDSARRAALQERLLAPALDQDAWRAGNGDPAPMTAAWAVTRCERDPGLLIALETRLPGLTLRKSVVVGQREPGLFVSYTIENTGAAGYQGSLLSEWNLGLPGEDGWPGLEELSGSRPAFALTAGGQFSLVTRLDGAFTGAWSMPVQTVSSSERGVELSYQGACLAFVAPLTLEPGARAEGTIRWSVNPG